MSMSMYVKGIVPPDEKYKKMLTIFKACEDANVEPPDEVWSFFENETPDESGVIVELTKEDGVERYCEDMIDGFEVDLTKLPKKIKKLRFYCSW